MTSNYEVGITERGDAALDLSWIVPVQEGLPSILITKDPLALSRHLDSSMNVIVHCTITGYGGTKLEPNVITPDMAVKGLLRIIDIIGIERVVLRIDPIIPCNFEIKRINIKDLIPSKVYCKIRKRISFLDNYEHVKRRFKEAGLKPLPYSFHAPLEDRKKIVEAMDYPEVCGEPGISCTGCVSIKDLEILKVNPPKRGKPKQRVTCSCLSSKKELLDNRKQCAHGCLYCYWR
jgi:DNA repair photolyase